MSNEPIKVSVIKTENGLFQVHIFFRRANGIIGTLVSKPCQREEVKGKVDLFVNQLDLSYYPFDNPEAKRALGEF